MLSIFPSISLHGPPVTVLNEGSHISLPTFHRFNLKGSQCLFWPPEISTISEISKLSSYVTKFHREVVIGCHLNMLQIIRPSQ